jgi:dihydrofolate synthase/folylpolyglutamate synthase
MTEMQITDFAEAQAALRRFYGKPSGPYTLEVMRTLLAHVGNPQDTLRVVHIAGTSGKTSTSYFAASLLKTAGLKVGLTVSPHVDEINERVQIDLLPLPEAVFCRELGEFLELVASCEAQPSYFEVMVAFAYWEFARQKVDYAVVEVGMGGLLDGTNVIDRADKLCIITDIGLDHTEILGSTIGEIATQKAGIIQTNNEIYMYDQGAEVMDAVVARQHEVGGATLHLVPQMSPTTIVGLPLFQERNFCLAEAAIQHLLKRDGHTVLGDVQLQQAAEVYIPARMERLQRGDKTIIVDGSHNAQKLQTLFDSIDHEFPDVPRAALVGFVDGDTFRLQQSLATLQANVKHIITTSFYSEKDYPKHSVTPEVVLEAAHKLGWNDVDVESEPADALRKLLARPEPLLIVTGSFYLLNHIRPLLVEANI